jgi:hypothetical protein
MRCQSIPPEIQFSFLAMADYDELYGEVGRKLRQARVTPDLSQERLAQQLGSAGLLLSTILGTCNISISTPFRQPSIYKRAETE